MLAFVGDDAELRQLERLELDLAGRELVAEGRVLDDRLAAGFDLAGEIANAAEPLLGEADPRDAGALIADEEFRAMPTLVRLADQVLDGHFAVVEEHLVDCGAAFYGLD